MNTYYSTESVQAIEVKYIEGNKISDKKKPKEKDLTEISHTFIASCDRIKVGDFVTFRGGAAVAVFRPSAFAELYERVVTDEEAIETVEDNGADEASGD